MAAAHCADTERMRGGGQRVGMPISFRKNSFTTKMTVVIGPCRAHCAPQPLNRPRTPCSAGRGQGSQATHKVSSSVPYRHAPYNHVAYAWQRCSIAASSSGKPGKKAPGKGSVAVAGLTLKRRQRAAKTPAPSGLPTCCCTILRTQAVGVGYSCG